jgi:hypothetical protein
MQQQIFKPKYPRAIFLGFLLIVSIEAYLLWQILSGIDASSGNVLAAVIFGLGIIIMPYAVVKQIVFGSQFFSIEKYFWPTRTIEYTDVIDVGTALIRTQKGSFAFRSMSNAEELHNILTGLIEQGKINRYQIENKAVNLENVGKKALLPAGIISFILWTVIFIVWQYKESLFRDLSIVLIFVPIYFLVYQFLKGRVKSQ